jgi:hypothetical protein
LGTTVPTDVGGQGSWAPEELWKYTPWQMLWSGANDTAMESIWVSYSEKLKHRVFYAHTGTRKVEGVQSLGAWKIKSPDRSYE